MTTLSQLSSITSKLIHTPFSSTTLPILPHAKTPFNMANSSVCGAGYALMTLVSMRNPRNRFSSSSNQGYPDDIIETASTKVKTQPRHSVPQYQDNSTDVNKRIPLVLTYHPTNIQVNNIIFENYPIISYNHETRDKFDQPPLLSWKKDNNLQHLLVSSDTSQLSGSNQPCNRSRCKSCKYITDTKAVSCHKSKFSVTETFACTSTNLIYCIQCLKCNKLYIGETMRRLADRSAEHLKVTDNH